MFGRSVLPLLFGVVLLLALPTQQSSAAKFPLGKDIWSNETAPFGVSAAFAGATAGSAMAITWSTMNTTADNVVMYGTHSEEYIHVVLSGEPTSYYQSYQHHAVLEEGIIPNTTYYYRVGSPVGGMSEEFSFISAKGEGDFSRISMAVFGDMGIDESQNTMMRLKALGTNVNFHYHVGDIGYADDHNTEDPLNNKAFEETWNTWQDDMESVTANYGYMVCPGNHEASCKVSGSEGCPHQLNNFTAYNNRFRMPSPESGGVENMWYSFDYGMVHFVSISTETDYKGSPEGPKSLWHAGPFGDQLDWLSADLEEANQNRKIRPWIVVIGHRPLYSSVDGDFPPNAIETLREAIETTLYDNNVDMYINGHVHAYERMYPIYQGEVDPNVYNNPRFITPLVIGNAGCLEGVSSFTEDVPDYVAYRNNRAWGYGILTFEDEENLSLQAFEDVAEANETPWLSVSWLKELRELNHAAGIRDVAFAPLHTGRFAVFTVRAPVRVHRSATLRTGPHVCILLVRLASPAATGTQQRQQQHCSHNNQGYLQVSRHDGLLCQWVV